MIKSSGGFLFLTLLLRLGLAGLGENFILFVLKPEVGLGSSLAFAADPNLLVRREVRRGIGHGAIRTIILALSFALGAAVGGKCF